MHHLARHRFAPVAALATTLLAIAPATAPATTPVPADAAVVSVSNAAFGSPIPAGFLGLSLENDAVIPYAGADPKALNPVFLQLVRNLTPYQSPELRIGGDSTDWAWYPVPGLTKPSRCCRRRCGAPATGTA